MELVTNIIVGFNVMAAGTCFVAFVKNVDEGNTGQGMVMFILAWANLSLGINLYS